MDRFQGLENVFVTDSKISQLLPETNDINYGGHSISQVLENYDYLKTVFLLWNHRLPTKSELKTLKKKEKSFRTLSPEQCDFIQSIAKNLTPIDALRTFVSFLPSQIHREFGFQNCDWQTEATYYTAKATAAVAAIIRLHRGETIIADCLHDDSSLDFLARSVGRPQTTDQARSNDQAGAIELLDHEEAKLLDQMRMIYAEHELNASTFACRVTASTECDMAAGLVSAISTIKGDLHGGALEKVAEHFKSISSEKTCKAYIDHKLNSGKKIMGFGHRVYMKSGDPRYPLVYNILKRFEQIRAQQHQTATAANLDFNTPACSVKASTVCEWMSDEMNRRKNLKPNLDLAAAPTYMMFGFAPDQFVALLAMSRIPGWSAHFIEQKQTRKIIRPRANYTGNAIHH